MTNMNKLICKINSLEYFKSKFWKKLFKTCSFFSQIQLFWY